MISFEGKMDKFRRITQSSCSLWINDWRIRKNGEWRKMDENAAQVKYTLHPNAELS